MLHAIISGDVIAYTSLSIKGKGKLDDKLQSLIYHFENSFDVYGRLIKGDYLECYVPQPSNALRVMLGIKAFVKSINLTSDDVSCKNRNRIKYFKNYAIRLAMGVGKLNRLDLSKGIIDGEAIYLSGRILTKEQTHDKKRIVIKNTLFFQSEDNMLNDEMLPLFALIDVIMNSLTLQQSKVVFLKLVGKSENDIADEMNIGQSTVNYHSIAAGWNALETAVLRFEQVLKNKESKNVLL